MADHDSMANYGMVCGSPMGVFMLIGATSNMLRSFFDSFLAYFME